MNDSSVPAAYPPQLAVAKHYLNAGGYYLGPLYGSHGYFEPLQQEKTCEMNTNTLIS